ncbi:hypothetical protein RhiJN_02625 [Ceratobasidium sp. AG-Ba]|nr:hypothetical protein RhiJN_02625 [Ceratobasidium sp. AG-Ba]QRW03498.1 hypothetical protein RhiLY_02497 [Ceratobasidium sp. AG-Ba]
MPNNPAHSPPVISTSLPDLSTDFTARDGATEVADASVASPAKSLPSEPGPSLECGNLEKTTIQATLTQPDIKVDPYPWSVLAVFAQPNRRMADAEPVRVLPTSEVEALLTELAALFSTLPESLPVVEPAQSKYGRFLGFVPDPELLEERGVVGAVNTALERALRDRRDGLKIIERIQKYLVYVLRFLQVLS